MRKVPVELRKNVATNIKHCRKNKYPKRGGAKRCAEEFGVSAQQWSHWESGSHMPNEFRMMELADFFDVDIEYLRRDNSVAPGRIRVRHNFAVVRIDNGTETPLHVEVERVVYHTSCIVKMERIL